MVKFNRSYGVGGCLVSNRLILIHTNYSVRFFSVAAKHCALVKYNLVFLIIEIGENDWDRLWKSNFSAFSLVAEVSTSS